MNEGPESSVTTRLAERALERTIAGRRAEYEKEMARIIESTYELIRESGSIDPPMRDILSHAGLSTQAFYRYFHSKDELMLALLDEGRRRLMTSLRRRMQRVTEPDEQLRAWIEGVLAQASSPSSALRTRPWIANEQRLSELFPHEQRSSVDLLVELLVDPVRKLSGIEDPSSVLGRARAVYLLTFATLSSYLVVEERPSTAQVDELVEFCLRGVSG